MNQWPGKLGGKAKLAGWLNRLVDRSRAGEIKQIIGGRLIETSDGKCLIVEAGAGTGDSIPPIGGMEYVGEWSAGLSYAAQKMVTRGALGEFICVQAVTGVNIGTEPETGAPFWKGLTCPPQATWLRVAGSKPIDRAEDVPHA